MIATREIQAEFGLPHFVASVMVAHGVRSIEQAATFLNPDLDRDWCDPYLIPAMKEAADRIEQALRDGERILVFGDFDLDGISATAVLTRGLRKLGGHVDWLIPRRFDEGYGITDAAIERAEQFNSNLVVTVDCGISNGNEVRDLLERGIDVVVTDHHEPGSNVPDVVVTDPKLDPDCPSTVLAGVGVALKLVQVVGARFGKPNLWRDYTDFATLGTVADLMPLTGENRALVADGLKRMNEAPRPCIAALVGVCNVADKRLTSTNLSFSLVPRLNAAGRMGNADLALELLMEDDFEQACAKAAELDAVNDRRRAIEADLAQAASVQAEQEYHGERALVVAGEGWHEGVKGIVASRLVSKYGVPALLFTIEGDEARGSGRSVGQVNLFKAVESCSDILTRFGGHEAAVGVTLPVDKLPEFRARLCDYMGKLPESSFHPLVKVDAQVDLGELTIENVEQLERLAPFGQENPTPRFMLRNVRLANCRAVGATKNHLSCTLTDGVNRVDGIMFHCDHIDTLLTCGCVVDAVFEAQIDEWRGRRKVKCMLQALEPAALCPAMRACLPPDDIEFVGEMYDEWNQERDLSEIEADQNVDVTPAESRAYWESVAAHDPDSFDDAVVGALIGDGDLHAAQREALDALSQGRSILAVMGTGRGKSLIFQVHAARIAVRDHAASLFMYPLRALIADQRFHLTEMLEPFGLSVAVLTGETEQAERRRVYRGLSEGTVDVVLTTPEYAVLHAPELARSGRIRFLAVDEAHHMAERGGRKRQAYAALRGFIHDLGNPTVLALTATAPDNVAETVRRELQLDGYVYDAADRPNLAIDDRRGLRDKDSYLAGIVGTGEKTIVYVNSRVGTVELARQLRMLVPQVAMQIGFYNAGLSREERQRVERLFRDDVLRVLVCTSAFGEGVNIRDVRHVVLYGMPFSEVEFNQLSGRAGRDGTQAVIHLLYGRRDVETCEGILRTTAPRHDDMAQIYRELRRMQREHVQGVQGWLSASDDELAQRCNRAVIVPQVCANAVKVFSDLGLVDVESDDGTEGRRLRVVEGASRVELTDSVYYREGTEEIGAFEHFRDWALGASADELRNRMIRPILPTDPATDPATDPSTDPVTNPSTDIPGDDDSRSVL